MKKIILGVSILILIGAAGFTWSHYSAKNKRIHTEELFWQGRKAADNNDDLKALKLLAEAVSQAPENAEFNFWAGISAKKMGKKELAYSYFEKSWDIGKKEPEVFINLIATSALPKIQRSMFFESKANDIADEQARLELTALLKYQRQKLEDAAAILKKLVTKYPEGAYAEFYATVLMQLKQPEAALEMLEGIHAKGNLNQASYIILTEIYMAIDNMEAAKDLYTEAASKGLNSTEVILNYGKGLFFYGGGEKAEDVLTTIKLPKLFSPSDIASAETFRKALQQNSQIATLLINNSNSALKNSLNKTTNNRFTNLNFIELATVALNNFCQSKDWYKEDLIPAGAEIDIPNRQTPSTELSDEENFIRNAQVLSLAFPDSLKVPDFNRSSHEARIILMMIESAKTDPTGLENILKLAEGSRRWLEGERYFGKYLLETRNNETAEEYFEAATALLSDNDVIQINLADNLANQGKYQDSLVVFDKATANSLILARSPMILQMRSGVMIASGDLKGGENILISLFKRGYTTQEMLLRLSRVAFDLGDIATANMAIDKLKSYAVKVPRLHLITASLLLQFNNTADAISELDKLLASSVPTEVKEAAILLKATAEFNSDKASAALQTLSSINDLTEDGLILKAQALNAVGKKEEALKILESLKTLPENALTLYATLLAGTGEIDKALVQLQKVLELTPDNVDALTNTALLLNTQGQTQEAIDTLNRALDLAPQNIKANLVLSQLLLTTGNPTDAANLALSVLDLAPNNPTALQILPSAYNAKQEFIKAFTISERGLRTNPKDPFITMQKAIALVGISNKLQKLKTGVKVETKDKNQEELLQDEIASLTDDILYTGAISELSERNIAASDSNIEEFANGRNSIELKQEAISVLDQIIDQPAAQVYKLEIELMLNRNQSVLATIAEGKLKANELFSLGVISDERKAWDISAAAYLAAYTLQPTNPIILNNYANAVVLSKMTPDQKTKELLLQTATDIPALFKGDVKAVNTAAMIYNFLGEWKSTRALATEYPEQFKLSPKLGKLLSIATNELETQQLQAEAQQKATSDETSKATPNDTDKSE